MLIRTTGEHSIRTAERGWVAARELQPGDRLWCLDGTTVQVQGVRDTGDWQTAYNLRVADRHTYFVGADGWGFAAWAHNACFDVGLYASLRSNAEYPRHHVPQVRAGTYAWGNEYDPNEAPAIIIPLWMHKQIDPPDRWSSSSSTKMRISLSTSTTTCASY